MQTTTDTTVDRNKAISKRWHEAWGTNAIDDEYEAWFAPDFTAEILGLGVVDRDEYIARDRAFRAAFSDSCISIEEIVGESDTVMVRMTWEARHTGEIFGIAPTGRRFMISGFAADRFRDGRIVGHVRLFDRASLLGQLGEAPGGS
jgi:predicted ester cyclase